MCRGVTEHIGFLSTLITLMAASVTWTPPSTALSLDFSLHASPVTHRRLSEPRHRYLTPGGGVPSRLFSGRTPGDACDDARAAGSQHETRSHNILDRGASGRHNSATGLIIKVTGVAATPHIASPEPTLRPPLCRYGATPCFSLIFAAKKTPPVITFAFALGRGLFRRSTKRQKGISPQEKASFGSLEKAEV